MTPLTNGNELLVGGVITQLAEAGSDVFVVTPENPTARELLGVDYLPGIAYFMKLGREPHIHPSTPQDPSRIAKIPFMANTAVFTLVQRPEPLVLPPQAMRMGYGIMPR